MFLKTKIKCPKEWIHGSWHKFFHSFTANFTNQLNETMELQPSAMTNEPIFEAYNYIFYDIHYGVSLSVKVWVTE